MSPQSDLIREKALEWRPNFCCVGRVIMSPTDKLRSRDRPRDKGGVSY